jgi:dienelactone hydrolase
MYLDGDAEGVFAFFNAAHRGPGETAVLICPPFGWDLACPYRARREWAEHLAAQGYPTIRIDLPATGDSAGEPTDPGLLQAWTSAVAAAARRLRSESSARRVVAIGVGLGGLVAYRAASAGAAIEDLVLWSVPAHGRVLVREMRALTRLSRASAVVPDDAEPTPLPDGAVLAAGYLLSAETTAALEALDLSELPLPGAAARRVLLLGRGSTRVDESLRRALERAGASVAVACGPGRGRIGETFACVDRWLAGAHGRRRRLAGRRPPRLAGAPGGRARRRPPTGAAETEPRVEQVSLRCEGVELRERAIWIERPCGRLFGVLAEPVAAPQELCAVLLNAGPQRHIGPNRMWVELARRWAAQGVPSLRIDLACIGDSDGDARTLAIPGALYAQEYVDETIATLEWLCARGLPNRFLLLGLCSGAYWALHAALRDERVAASVMINPRRLIWDERLAGTRRRTRVLRRLSRGAAWRGLLGDGAASAGYVEPAEEPAPAAQGQGSHNGAARRERERPVERLDLLFDALQAREQRALLMLTGWEPLHEQLVACGAFAQRTPWPNLELATFATAVETHTLAPLWLQREIHELIDGFLEEELGRTLTSAAR